MSEPRTTPQRISAIPRKSGCRWFVRFGACTYFDCRGFRTKADADEWINAQPVDWRVGFYFRLKGDDKECEIVDRKGKRAKA